MRPSQSLIHVPCVRRRGKGESGGVLDSRNKCLPSFNFKKVYDVCICTVYDIICWRIMYSYTYTRWSSGGVEYGEVTSLPFFFKSLFVSSFVVFWAVYSPLKFVMVETPPLRTSLEPFPSLGVLRMKHYANLCFLIESAYVGDAQLFRPGTSIETTHGGGG